MDPMMGGLAPSMPAADFWRGRRVLVTGHTGFKGSWLCAWLDLLGAQTMGLSLPPPDAPLWEALRLESVTEVRADVASHAWQDVVVEFEPEIVFHLAAQALVSVGYADPVRTFTTNIYGSVQVLDTFSRLSAARAAVMVTTDKVYDSSQPIPFTEESYLGGRDPYSASKAAMELVIRSWPDLPFPVVTARAGNVIGGGDSSPDRLLPDLIRSWSHGDQLVLRRPNAVRPWQHVLEPVRGYLLYAERLVERDLPRALNLGPDTSQCVSVDEVVAFAAEHWQAAEDQASEPHWAVAADPQMAETELLVLDSSLAGEALGWSNRLGWRQAVALTIDWHRAHVAGADALALMRTEITDYCSVVGSAP